MINSVYFSSDQFKNGEMDKFIHNLNASLKGIMPYHTKEKSQTVIISILNCSRL